MAVPKRTKGRSARFNIKGTFSSATRKTDGDGAVLANEKESKSSLSLYVEKTLEVDDKGRRTKYSRAYQKAPSATDGRAEDKPYHNRTVLFTNVKGKWKVSSVGKPQLSGRELEDLAEDADENDKPIGVVIYPSKAVKVGEKWKLVGKDVADYYDFLNITADTVKGEGKLVKAYKKDGKQWGVIEYVITFAAKLGDVKDAKGEIRMTADQPLDDSATAGKVDLTITLAGSKALEEKDKKVTLSRSMKIVSSCDVVEVK